MTNLTEVDKLLTRYANIAHDSVKDKHVGDFTFLGMFAAFLFDYEQLKENSGQPTAPVGPFVIQGRKVGRDKWSTWNAYGDDDIESPLVFETYDAANDHLNSSRLPAVYGNYEYRIIPASYS